MRIERRAKKAQQDGIPQSKEAPFTWGSPARICMPERIEVDQPHAPKRRLRKRRREKKAAKPVRKIANILRRVGTSEAVIPSGVS